MTARTRTLADYVEQHALARPEHPALRIEDDTLTYRQLVEQASAVAAGLAIRGVQAGTTVALILPNCVELVVAWLALSRIGAVAAPMNPALRTEGLAGALSLSGAEVAIIDEQLLPPAEAAFAGAGRVHSLIVRGRAVPHTTAWSELSTEPGTAPRHDVGGGDPSILLFTSGSTGRSKACVLPHRFVTRQAEIFSSQLGLTDADVLFCPFPLFHADAAIFTVAPAFVLGATATLVERFSARRFWDEVRRYHATVFDFMGATLTMLFNQEPAPDDANNPARLGWGVPLPGWAEEFERRFGVELVEVYGLSDVGIVLYNRPGEPRRPASCGRAVHPFDVRVLGTDGFATRDGEVGEICVRALEPHVIMTEYLEMPETTVHAWRDLWFHTGDRAYRDADGYFYFIGRSTDVIRRRGENISAPEIEDAIAGHPAVLEVAAFGVPSELTEEDVMVAVALRPWHELSAEGLLDHCARNLPRHMVPRYVEFLDALPKTPTEKVEKHALVARGVTQSTFDRDEKGS